MPLPVGLPQDAGRAPQRVPDVSCVAFQKEVEVALSAFGDKSHRPTEEELRSALGPAYRAWERLVEEVALRIRPVSKVWGFTSSRTGWGLRLRHGERVLLYLTPALGQFLVSFALGEKAVAAARASGLPDHVLTVIEGAPRYAEGRGVRFEVRNVREIPPLAVLAEIKNAN